MFIISLAKYTKDSCTRTFLLLCYPGVKTEHVSFNLVDKTAFTQHFHARAKRRREMLHIRDCTKWLHIASVLSEENHWRTLHMEHSLLFHDPAAFFTFSIFMKSWALNLPNSKHIKEISKRGKVVGERREDVDDIIIVYFEESILRR